MRINHNISSMVTQAALFKTNKAMSKSLERLSTGLRINSASDDAAGLAISENLKKQVNGQQQAQRNAQDGQSMLQIAEGAASSITDILQRMRELSVQASNDTLTSTERGYADQEFGDLRNEIDRIANVTNYNGNDLISSKAGRFGSAGATSNTSFWIDSGSKAGVDSLTVTIDTLSVASLGGNLATASLTDQAGATDAMSYIDIALNSVNTARANLGAYINRLDDAVNNLMVSQTNQSAAESLITDVDFASESSNFTKNQILMQSGTAMLSQANMAPQSVLTLLQR